MLYPVLSNMNNWLDNDFDDMIDTNILPRVNFTAPAINVKENDKDYEIELAAPGTTKDDFKVNVDKDIRTTLLSPIATENRNSRMRTSQKIRTGMRVRIICAVSSLTAITSRL